MDKLVSVNWLKKNIEDNGLILLDASMYFDPSKTILGAQHFDIKNIFSDPDNPLPNSFPNPEYFQLEAQKLGINDDSTLIVFDDKGIFTSPRVWWMFTVMGFKNIAVLDGGSPAWIAQNLPIAAKTIKRKYKGNFKVNFDPSQVKSYAEVLTNCTTSTYQIIDARSSGRFLGREPEPRPHLQSGHIQNSINLPYTDVLKDGKFKSTLELEKIFSEFNLSERPIIFSCGSGITACIILLALALISDHEHSVYDGSWTEWAEKQSLTV